MKPWIAIDLLTNENLGRYETEVAALIAHRGQPIEVIYRPDRRRRK